MPWEEVNRTDFIYRQSKIMYSAFLCNLRRIRKSKNISQEIIAAKCGISTQAYSKIETGQAMPLFSTVCLISCALGIDIKTLTTDFMS